MAKAAQGSKQGLYARIAETQRGDALAARRAGWQLQTFKKGRGWHCSVSDALDLQQFGIDLPPDRPQMGQGVQAFGALEVERVVDRGLRPQSALLFEVLLDVRVVEFDVQAGCDAVGDHARLVGKLWGRCVAPEARGKQQANAVWSTEVQVVADDGFEEVAPVHRCGEDVGQAH